MIELEFRGVPPLLLNSRMDWRSAGKQKLEWYGRVLVAVGKKRLRPPVPFQRAVVIHTRHCGYKRPDQTNLVSSFKWLEDALVYVGILAGDQWHQIETFHEWQPASPKEKRTTTVIQPVF